MVSFVYMYVYLVIILELFLIGYGDLFFKVSEIWFVVIGESIGRIDEFFIQKGKCLQMVLVFGGVDVVLVDVF